MWCDLGIHHWRLWFFYIIFHFKNRLAKSGLVKPVLKFRIPRLTLIFLHYSNTLLNTLTIFCNFVKVWYNETKTKQNMTVKQNSVMGQAIRNFNNLITFFAFKITRIIAHGYTIKTNSNPGPPNRLTRGGWDDDQSHRWNQTPLSSKYFIKIHHKLSQWKFFRIQVFCFLSRGMISIPTFDVPFCYSRRICFNLSWPSNDIHGCIEHYIKSLLPAPPKHW